MFYKAYLCLVSLGKPIAVQWASCPLAFLKRNVILHNSVSTSTRCYAWMWVVLLFFCSVIHRHSTLGRWGRTEPRLCLHEEYLLPMEKDKQETKTKGIMTVLRYVQTATGKTFSRLLLICLNYALHWLCRQHAEQMTWSTSEVCKLQPMAKSSLLPVLVWPAS